MIYLDYLGHLFSDESVDELYNFAVTRLGLKPEWNHYSRNFPHFDLTTETKKKQAIKLGAIYIDDSRTLIGIFNKIKTTYPTSGDGALPFIKGKGLRNQDILRVDFKTYFERNPR